MESRRLVIRPGAIGDFVLSLPAIESLEPAEVWAPSVSLPMARRVSQARSIASTGLDLLGITEPPDPALVSRLRAFGEIISWYGANRPEFRALVETLKLPFHFLAALPPPGGKTHAADFFLEQTKPWRRRTVPPAPRLDCPEPVERGYAVIHPFSGGSNKCWPLERFQEVAHRLRDAMPVFWCAGPEDALPDAVRIPDLHELACWLAGARLYLGNDSGISHLAAAAGAPVIALFGPTDPAVWEPRGAAVEIIARRSLEEITVDEVLARCEVR